MQYRIHREGDTPNTPSSASTPVDNWERNTLREVLLAAYKEQRRARIWRNIWRGVAVLIFLSLIFGFAEEEGKTTSIHARSEHTAVIDLTGEIGNDIDDQVQILRDSMEAAYNNGNAKAIIIRANSPGGSPVVSNTAFNEVRRLKAEHKDIPVYLVAEDMCASGCYYIAAAADKLRRPFQHRRQHRRDRRRFRLYRPDGQSRCQTPSENRRQQQRHGRPFHA